MNIDKHFESFINQEKLFSVQDNILLAVSGGIDSIALCELFYQSGLRFGIAHCNFQLRGDESDGDEALVKALAEKHQVPFHTISFKTAAFAKKNKLSIQVAARDLRYNWFEEIRAQHHYKYIATAHHQDDSIETFFINLTRGTGISGLHGILPKQGNIIRPLLFTTKDEISTYVKKHKLNFREDSSNASDKYLRNNIRHHLIPLLKELNPNVENALASTIHHLQDVEQVYKTAIEQNRKKIVKRFTTDNHQEGAYSISIKHLQQLKPVETYLYEFLKPFNFNANTVKEIIHSFEKGSGKQFLSGTHRLIKDRDSLLIEKTESKTASKSKKIATLRINKKQETLISTFLSLRLKKESKPANYKVPQSNAIAALDVEKLKFPLEVRKWQQGDAFQPLGMKGQKKLSDFFIDKKLSLPQKEQTWVLCSENNVVWVIGHRIDDRFKITEKTSQIYLVELI